MPRVVIGNNKGGAAKTATTLGLAGALANAGHSVLVVDIDPQANASRRLGFRLDQATHALTIAEVLAHSTPGQNGLAAQAITQAGWGEPYDGRIDLIPSRFDLENRVSEAATVGAVGRLRRALDSVDDDYTVTLIDCPPSLGHLTQLALAAADVAIATVVPEYDAIEGALRYRDFIAAAAADLGNPGLRFAGVIVCIVREKLNAHRFQLEGLPDSFGADAIWSPRIPDRSVVKDAGDSAVPIGDVGTPAAREIAALYGALAERLLTEVK